MSPDDQRVLVGTIQGLFGVRGWVKIFSHTRPRENILRYSPWRVTPSNGGAPREMTVAEGQPHGKTIIARLDGIVDRDQAARLLGAEISLARDQLDPLGEGEYYWSDLIGLEVVNTQGDVLGRVDHLLETGANDVLVVHGGEEEILMPLVFDHVVLRVDLTGGTLLVDWERDF